MFAYLLKLVVAFSLFAVLIAFTIKFNLNVNTLPEFILLLMIATISILYMYAKKNSRLRHILLLSVIFSVLYIAIMMMLRSNSRYLAVLIGAPSIALISGILTRKFQNYLSYKIIIATLLLTPVLIEGPVRVIRCSSTLGSLPTFLFALLGVIVGYELFRKYSIKSFLLAFVAMVSVIWMYSDGYDKWMNRLSFGSFDGKVCGRSVINYTFQDEKGNTICLSQMKGKTVLLDFWSATCGVCWEKFPKVQKLYDDMQSNEDIIVAGVYVDYGENEWDDNIRMLHEKYTFPSFKVDGSNSLVSDLPIKMFPTTAIFDSEGKLVYLGNLAGAINMLESIAE